MKQLWLKHLYKNSNSEITTQKKNLKITNNGKKLKDIVQYPNLLNYNLRRHCEDLHRTIDILVHI